MNRKLYVGGLIVVLMFGLVGCMLFDRDDPTTPSLEANASQLVNCYDGEGDPSGFGVYMGVGHFVVNVPKGGDYVIQYKTKWGLFDFVFRAKGARMIYIGLQPDDEVADAIVVPTTITAVESEAETLGGMLIFSRPGLGNLKKLLHLITLLPEGVDLFAPTLDSGIQRVVLIKEGKRHEEKDKNGVVIVIELKYEVVHPIIATSPATS